MPASSDATTGLAPEYLPEPDRRRGFGPLEALALLFLTVGSVLLGPLGWFIGVAVLWASATWTKAEKWLGTLVLPGGLLPVSVASTLPFGSPGCTHGTRDGTLVKSLLCLGEGQPIWLGWMLLVVLAVCPGVVYTVLGVRAARRNLVNPPAYTGPAQPKTQPVWPLPLLALVQVVVGSALIWPLTDNDRPWRLGTAALLLLFSLPGLAVLALAVRNCRRLWRVRPLEASGATAVVTALAAGVSGLVATIPVTERLWEWSSVLPGALCGYLLVVLVREVRRLLTSR